MQHHRMKFQEPMPIESLVQYICDQKHALTLYGGNRPYGVSFLVAGYDDHHGWQLYHTDPSGNYAGWEATAIGNNNSVAKDMFKKDLVGKGEDGANKKMNYREALDMSVQVMAKCTDTKSPDPQKMEFAVLSKFDGRVAFHVLSGAEAKKLHGKPDAF